MARQGPHLDFLPRLDAKQPFSGRECLPGFFLQSVEGVAPARLPVTVNTQEEDVRHRVVAEDFFDSAPAKGLVDATSSGSRHTSTFARGLPTSARRAERTGLRM